MHVAAIVHFAHWKVAGSTITPLEPSESMQTVKLGYVNAGAVVLGISVLLTLVLGRWFCGWVCHFVAYQDLCAWLLRRVGLKPKPVRSRLLRWIPIAAAFYMFAWPAVYRALWTEVPAPELRAKFTTSGFWDTFPGPVMAVLTILFAGFLLVYWMGAKGFCTYGCPYGAFFGVADRFAPMRVKVTDACNTCGHCTVVCSSNVRVHEEVALYRRVVDPGCMKTMDCVKSCPNDALYFGLATRPLRARTRKLVHPAADFSWGEEVAMALAGLFAFFAFRGIYFVPFLMALTIGVLFAIVTLTIWRLVRRTDLTFQNHVLKVAGRLTGVGRLAVILGIVAVLFTLHTSVVQFMAWRGSVAADRVDRMEARDPERAAAIAEGVGWYTRSLSMGLFDDGGREFELAWLERQRLDYDAAERHVRRVLELLPGDPDASVFLADVVAIKGNLAEGEAILRALVAERPDFEPALMRLRQLEERRAQKR
ncbi:MAG: 4Fe-4S binding protein [Planctomycetota bacterium]